MKKQNKVKVFKLSSSEMVHSPGMVENYKHSIKVGDNKFKKMFEDTYFEHYKRDVVDSICKAILDGRYRTGEEEAVFVFVGGLAFHEAVKIAVTDNKVIGFQRDTWEEYDYCFIEREEDGRELINYNGDRFELTVSDCIALDWVILTEV